MTVEIFDNIFNHEELVFLDNFMLENPGTCANRVEPEFVRNSSGKLLNNHLFFGKVFFQRKNINVIEILDPSANILFDVLEKIQKKTNRKYYIKQISTNLQHSGCDGTTHVDGPSDYHKTIMLMTNCYWEPEWGGQFQLTNYDDEVIEEYEYKPGRVIIFPGNHPHRGLGPKNNLPYVYRTTLVFRTEPLVF